MHSGGLILGGNCGSLVVAGVKEKHSNNVKGVVRLLATSLHKKIIEEETADAYPQEPLVHPNPHALNITIVGLQNVIVERPEDAQIATVEVEEDSAPASLEFVQQSESLQVQTDELHVEGAAVQRADATPAPPMYAEASTPGAI